MSSIMLSSIRHLAGRLTVVVCATALLALGCSGDPRPLQEAVEVQEIGLARLVIESDQVRLENTFINPQQTIQYTFKAFDIDNNEIEVENTDRRWSVSNFDVADISGSGLLRGKFNGRVTVGLRIGGIVAEPVVVNVSSAVLVLLDGITGEDSLTECSQSQPYTANGTFDDGSVRELNNLEWRVVTGPTGRLVSSNTSQATVGALSPGSVTLFASVGDVEGSKIIAVNDGLMELSVSDDPIQVERSANLPLTATATYTDEEMASQIVTPLASWSVTDGTDIASVTNENNDTKGVLRGLRVGQTQVFAECSDLLASADVNVVEPERILNLRIEPEDRPVELFINGGDVQLTAFAISAQGSDEEVTSRATWRVESGEDVITVDNSSSSGGLVRALSVGRATIEVSYVGVTEQVSVIVR